MKKANMVYIFYILAGAVLFTLGCMEVVDEFWSGMGGMLLLMGIVRLLRAHRFNKNEAYRDKVEVELADERNQFIRNKAWAWSGYLFVIFVAVLTIVMKAMGQELLSQAAGAAVCLMIVLYWISYVVLQKKY